MAATKSSFRHAAIPPLANKQIFFTRIGARCGRGGGSDGDGDGQKGYIYWWGGVQVGDVGWSVYGMLGRPVHKVGAKVGVPGGARFWRTKIWGVVRGSNLEKWKMGLESGVEMGGSKNWGQNLGGSFEVQIYISGKWGVEILGSKFGGDVHCSNLH